MLNNVPSPEFNKTFHQIYKANIAVLVEKFPLTFNKEFPLPLALGSHKEIHKATGWPKWKVHAVMCVWTARMEYVMMACSVKHRYHLNGAAMEYISEEHCKNFIIRLNNFRIRERIADFVKVYYKQHKTPALMSVPVKQRPDLSRWM